ncbi:MAG TPA: class I SAM-dependent methyltransferase [Steroidobacteraceae bacterium]
MPDSASPFDRTYFQKYYFDPRTAVTSRAEMRGRARMIAACVDYVGLPVRSILDAGCGVGLLRAPLRRHFRRAEYTGLDASRYLCQRYGWRLGTIQGLRTRERFDLAVCYDVLQYLDTAAAGRAIASLTRVCRGALYFGALTAEDWRQNCDRTRTDRLVSLRPAAWYRQELSRGFRPLGFGMWLRRGAPLTVWELDSAR